MANRKRDLSGARFGKLTALEPTDSRERGAVVWRCQCDCGEVVFLSAGVIPRVKSCGCAQHERGWYHLVGSVVNDWVCIGHVRTDRSFGHIMLWCNSITMAKKEGSRNQISRLAKFKLETLQSTKTSPEVERTKNSWRGMLARCLNPQHTAYYNYGARGITVCQDWLDFPRFLADMGLRPEGYELDRIDNNSGYSVANCRWVSRKTNLRNTRSNLIFNFNGRSLCLAEMSEISGIPYHTLHVRLTRLGWSVEDAMSKPVRRKK